MVRRRHEETYIVTDPTGREWGIWIASYDRLFDCLGKTLKVLIAAGNQGVIYWDVMRWMISLHDQVETLQASYGLGIEIVGRRRTPDTRYFLRSKIRRLAKFEEIPSPPDGLGGGYFSMPATEISEPRLSVLLGEAVPNYPLWADRPGDAMRGTV